MTALDAAVHRDEPGRQASLAACAVLDTAREASFDSIVFTVAQLFRAPIAMLHLIDRDRLWAKASVGPLKTEWNRNDTFCNAVIESEALLIVENATLDTRFSGLNCVTDTPHLRFCASAPLRGPGRYLIGTLCVVDYHPRSVPERQRNQFIQLAEEASELLRLRVPGLDLTT